MTAKQSSKASAFLFGPPGMLLFAGVAFIVAVVMVRLMPSPATIPTIAPAGGPYLPTADDGRQLGAEYSLSWDTQGNYIIKIPTTHRSFGLSYSVALLPGKYSWDQNCVVHLDYSKNGRGKLNPIATSPVILYQDAWALVEIGPQVHSCSVIRMP